jgi:hypothetical protein
MGDKNPLDIWCENAAIFVFDFTYFWLVIVSVCCLVIAEHIWAGGARDRR